MREEGTNFLLARLLLFGLVILIDIASSSTLPEWINSSSNNSDYYFGVGRAEMSDDNHRKTADDKALLMIASQIATMVSSRSSSTIEERNDITTKNLYTYSSKVTSMADIQGAEQVQYHIDKNTYYVQWKLNKEDYLKKLYKNKEKAVSIYRKYQNTSSGDIYERLSYLIPCYELISGMVGLNTSDDLGLDISIEIPIHIKDIISSIELEMVQSSFQGIMNRPLKDDIIIYASSSKGLPSGKKNISRLPIMVSQVSGDALFTSRNVSTGREGFSKFKINKINSHGFSRFKAHIDLRKFMSKSKSRPSFEKALYELAQDRTIEFELYADEIERDEVGHILISDEIQNKSNLEILRGEFREKLTNDGTFVIIMENKANDLIEKWEQEGKDVCSDKECQQEIGNELGVKKLIFNKISFNSEQFICNMFLMDIKNQEIEFEKNYDEEFPPSLDGTNQDKIVNHIKSRAGDIVEHFLRMAKRGTLNLSLPMSNVSATITKRDVNKWDDMEFTKTLPVAEFKLLAGTYEIELRRPGFENKKVIKSIGDHQPVSPDASELMLTRKSERRSFYKSLFLPGSGQFYQSEIGYEHRKYTGILFSISTLGGLTYSTLSFMNYLDAKDEYEAANDLYIAQKVLDNVNLHREIARSKHQNKENAKMRAIISLSATGLLWMLNAVEAYYRFPEYISHRSNSYRVAIEPNIIHGPGLTLKVKI